MAIGTAEMRALVIGASGLVGAALMRVLGANALGTYRTRARPGLVHFDARNGDEVQRLAEAGKADVIFVPAAEPNVEWCELHPEEARAANLRPVKAAVAGSGGRRVIAFSSDYVFDGRGGPYREDAPRLPLSVYGRIKVEIEDQLVGSGHAVIRTTTVYGYEPAPAKNFVLRLIASVREGTSVRVASDQISTPTFADDLAAAAMRVARQDAGIWHVAGPDLLPRSDLAREACRVFDLPETFVVAVPTSELTQVAVRPRSGGLLSGRYEALFGPPVRSIADGLAALRGQLAAG